MISFSFKILFEFKKTTGLINYWPIEGSTADVVSEKNMVLQLNAELTYDRFGTPNSALLLNHGYASIPSGVYFNPLTGGFTAMVWVKILSINSYQRVFEFGIGQSNNNVFICLEGRSYMVIFGTNSGQLNGILIELNTWYHLAVSVTNYIGSFYVNGVKVQEGTGNSGFLAFYWFKSFTCIHGQQRLFI